MGLGWYPEAVLVCIFLKARDVEHFLKYLKINTKRLCAGLNEALWEIWLWFTGRKDLIV